MSPALAAIIQNNIAFWIALILMVVSPIFCVMDAVKWVRRQVLLNGGQLVTGVVTDHLQGAASRSSKYFHIQITYRTEEDGPLHIKPLILPYAEWQAIPDGAELALVVDRKDPKNAELAGPNPFTATTLAWLVFSLAAGGYFWLWSRAAEQYGANLEATV